MAKIPDGLPIPDADRGRRCRHLKVSLLLRLITLWLMSLQLPRTQRRQADDPGWDGLSSVTISSRRKKEAQSTFTRLHLIHLIRGLSFLHIHGL